MRNNSSIHFLLFFLLSLYPLSAQDSWIPGTDWKIIKAARADVIFPAELEAEGRKAAAFIDGSMDELTRTLDVERIRRWKLILWYGNSYSGGYVTSGPRYSLWNSGIGSEVFSGGDWLSLMTAHEGRHMAQLDRINQGAGRFFYALFGDGGIGYLSLFCLPSWIFEGDAVLSETLLTEFGRGRSSDFSILMKAHVLEGDPSYSRMVNGSYRKIFPDWYEYGYFMVTHIRKNYGEEALSRIFSFSSSLPVPFLSFTLGIRRATGQWPYEIFKDMTDELRVLFEQQTELIEETPVEYIDRPGKKEYFSFSNPTVLPSGDIAAIKTDLNSRRKLNIYSDSGELIRSFNYDHYTGTGIRAGKEEIFFSGFSRDLRWSALEYRDICSVSIDDGRERRLTEGSRYIYPAPSPDNSQLGAVEFFTDGREAVVILELASGRKIKSFQPPGSTSPADITWAPGGEELIMILRSEEGQALASLHIPTGRWSFLTGFMKGRIEDPLLWEDYILYSSEEEGIRNIYAFNSEKGRFFRVTERKYGASNPAVKENTLYFIDYTGLTGEALVRMELNPSGWSGFSSADQDLRVDYFQSVLEADPVLSKLDSSFLPGTVSAGEYNTESYSPVKSVFNIHSWGIAPEALVQNSPELKFGLYSDDILGTASIYGYGSWNLNEKTPGGGISILLRPFYPEIALSGLVHGRKQDGTAWTESGIGAEISLPLDFSFGLKYRLLNLALGGFYYKYFDGSPDDGDTAGNEGGAGYLTGRLSWSSGIRGGYRRIFPLWGFTLDVSAAHNPLTEDFVYTGITRMSFPGLFRNNSGRLTLGGELREGSRPSGLGFGRGYEPAQGSRALSLVLDYDFPLLYPDLPLGAFFLRRFRGNLFGQIFYLDGELYPSAGAGGFIDYIPLNLERITLFLGVRFSYRFRDDKFALEIVISNG